MPDLVHDEDGRALALEVSVERGAVPSADPGQGGPHHRLLPRGAGPGARASRGCGWRDIDYVILVGGSSRVPLVRETVRAAFCNADLPEHVRSLDPLLHEPDLCVAYGAALRAATHGTRYLFPVGVLTRRQVTRNKETRRRRLWNCT